MVCLGSFKGNSENVTDTSSISNMEDVDEPQVTYNTVQLLEKLSDTEESSYRVGAILLATDFSSVGRILADEIAKEWSTYDSMTREQRLLSSKLWGAVSMQTDTWKECEEVIGFTVHNPLEALDWLNKTGYFGMDDAEVSVPVKHIQINADTTQATDRKVSQINVTAGYNIENIRITLSAALSEEAGIYTNGSGYAG